MPDRRNALSLWRAAADTSSVDSLSGGGHRQCGLLGDAAAAGTGSVDSLGDAAAVVPVRIRLVRAFLQQTPSTPRPMPIPRPQTLRRVLRASCAPVLLLGACSTSTGIDCSLIDPFPWAIVVTVVDAASGSPPEGVRGWTVGADQEVRDMQALGPAHVLGALIPGGTYDTFVEAAGYETWESRGVRTEAGECGGFVPVELQVGLERS